MAITDKNTIKSWFKTKLKPTQAQFWAWMDSFWHKNESIPTASISGLDDLVSMMVTLEKVTAVKTELEALIAGKVDKVDGKELSTEDFTTELKNKLDIIDMSEKLDAGDYDGSGEDLNNAIQEILTVLSSDDTTLDELQEIVNYIKQNKSTLDRLGISNIAGLTAALAAKVDTVAGKGLSTEDFTTALKTKLEGIDLSQYLKEIPDNSISYEKVSGTLTQRATDNDGTLDFAANGIVDIAASSNLTITFENLQQNKCLKAKIVITNSATITLPSFCVLLDGSTSMSGVDGTYYVYFDCWNATSGSESVLVTIAIAE